MTKFFVTGGTGLVGTEVIKELTSNGFQVSALARSAEAAQKLKKINDSIEIIEGTLEDLDIIAEAVKQADGVIHLAFINDFANFAESLKTDAKAIETIGSALESGKTFISTNGIGSYISLLGDGSVITEDVEVDTAKIQLGVERVLSEQYALGLAKKGVKSYGIRLPPTVHGEGDHGFVKIIVETSKKLGYVGVLKDGNNSWVAGNKKDLAKLYVLAALKGKPGSAYHGFKESVKVKEMCEFIGKELNLPVKELTAEELTNAYPFPIGLLSTVDFPFSSEKTQKELNWIPTNPKLFEDIKSYYL